MVTVRQAVENFLAAQRTKHNGPDLLDFYLKYGTSLETQVNVAKDHGEAVAGKKSTYTDGINTWFSFRIPKDANKAPWFKNYKLKFPLDPHVDGIGSTGFDWEALRSRYVGYDYDCIVGHAAGVGVDGDKLRWVQDAAFKYPYLTVRTSTGGGGLHLYVQFEDLPIFDCRNHTEHAVLARETLEMISRDTGFNFKASLDACGGNMWLWHRKSAGTEGLKPIKIGEPLSKRPTTTTVAVPEQTWTDLAKPFQKVPLGSNQERFIEELKKHARTDWDADLHLVKTHTKAIERASVELGLKPFETISPGTDLSVQNCYGWPERDGVIKFYRYQSNQEHESWTDEGDKVSIRVVCIPDWKTLANKHNGAATKTGFEFPTLEALAAAAAERGVVIEVPPGLEARPATIVDRAGTITVTVDRHPGDERPRGWSTHAKRWQLVIQPEDDKIVEDEGTTPHAIAERHQQKWAHNGHSTSLQVGEDLLLWQDGRWRITTDAELMPWITATCREVSPGVPKRMACDALNAFRSISSRTLSAAAPLWLGGENPDWDPLDVIPFRNGLLHVPSYFRGKDCFIPPTPLLYNRHCLGFDFDANAPEPTRWNQFLRELWDDADCHKLLCEFGGYCMTWDTSLQKMLMLIGAKRGGKGTITGLLQEMVGYNSSSPSFKSLTESFGLQPLRGTQLAVFPDQDVRGINRYLGQACQVLKAITGEDRMVINIKNKAQVTEQLRCRIVIQSNDPIAIPDGSGALQSRQLFLHFRNSFAEREDFHLKDKLRAELPGIALQFLEGLRGLQENGGRFTIPASSVELAEEVKRKAVPVSGFIGDQCLTDPQVCVLTNDLYEAYCHWAATNDGTALDSAQFGIELRKYLPTVKREKNAARYRGYVPDPKRPWYYVGLRLRTKQELELVA